MLLLLNGISNFGAQSYQYIRPIFISNRIRAGSVIFVLLLRNDRGNLFWQRGVARELEHACF